jgi:thiamine monophosphate synthase
MLILKNKYYLYIENTRTFNLKLIKVKNKFVIIYRNNKKQEDIRALKIFRLECKRRSIAFFIANNVKLCRKVKADGLYISAYNKSLNSLFLKTVDFSIIGSAHNFREIALKRRQGCDKIILSRLFKTDYLKKTSFFGIVKFNLIIKNLGASFIPLGGIRYKNLGKLKLVNSSAFAILSDIKKKPANIINRLF